MSATGQVAALWRWPVKSMGGEAMRHLRLAASGVAGDRTHAVFHEFKGGPRRLTAREAPGLLAWRASYPGGHVDLEAPPEPVLYGPREGRFAWADPELPRALCDHLGRSVWLHRDVRGQQDLQQSVLVTVEATRSAVEARLGAPLDLRRFRTNIHLELDAPAFAEQQWTGGRIRIGEVELELLHACKRCVIPTRDPATQAKWPELLRWLTRENDGLFGINARVTQAGEVGEGEVAHVFAESRHLGMSDTM
jgi:uncharacterized protein